MKRFSPRCTFSPVWTFKCLRNVADSLKVLQQYVHVWDWPFSPVCRSLCFFRDWRTLKVAPHSSHVNGLFSLWVTMCSRKPCLYENFLPQHWHENGFSPECIRSCSMRSFFLAIALLHTAHLKRFSPCFISTWRRNLSICVKAQGHSWHLYLRSVCLLKLFILFVAEFWLISRSLGTLNFSLVTSANFLWNFLHLSSWSFSSLQVLFIFVDTKMFLVLQTAILQFPWSFLKLL